MGRKRWMWIVAAILFAAVIAWAWVDGGRRPLEWIEQPIEMPVDAG